MEYLGIDAHSSESQICILTEQGEVLERRIRTRPDRLAERLGERRRARILIEAEWVARCLESLGHADRRMTNLAERIERWKPSSTNKRNTIEVTDRGV